jgi:hypothetical protein
MYAWQAPGLGGPQTLSPDPAEPGLGRCRGSSGGCCGGWSSGCCGRCCPGLRCLFVAGAFDFEPHQLGAHCHQLADLAAESEHLANHRRGNLHGCLVGHHLRQQLILRNLVAGLHVPGHHLDFSDAFADVGHLDDVGAHQDSNERFMTLCAGRSSRA